MDSSTLNEWAGRFIGEGDDTIADAVGTEWYTKSPGAAMVVLAKAASEGKAVELEIANGEVEVKCGGFEENGSLDELAKLIVTACYRCHNG